MSNLRFVATALPSGKAGILKPDANGYYSMYVGALNVHNSMGWYYPFEAAKHIFMDGSSEFNRRVAERALRGEVGHPKLLPGMSEAQYFTRLLSIYEENICVFFKSITLDFDNCYDANGNKVVGILAELQPDGKQAHVLERKLTNPDKGACFSIRSFTRDYPCNNTIHRAIRKVVTFDDVNEGGIALASKKFAPGLEDNSILLPQGFDGSLIDGVGDIEEGHLFTQGAVEEAIRQAAAKPGAHPGLEATGMFDGSLLADLGMCAKQVAAIEQRAVKAAWDTW